MASLDLQVNASYVYVSSRPANFGSLASGIFAGVPDVPSADTVYLSVGVRHDSGVTASLFANNLFDERNRQGRFRFRELDFDSVNTPRTIGLRVGYQF